MVIKRILFIFFLFLSSTTHGQNPTTADSLKPHSNIAKLKRESDEDDEKKGVVYKTDSLKPPFDIAKEKRLSDEDLAEKKEGVYVTAEPNLSSDPETGFGAGVAGQLFFDGKRSDPFFAYTPYRATIDLSVFYTTGNEKEVEAEWDVPYIFNTKWRLRGGCEYEIDPDNLYFGITEASLTPLIYFPNNDSSKAPVKNASFEDYSNNLVGNAAYYNTYQQVEKSFNFSMERSWFKSRVRTLIGYELEGFVTTTPLNDNSLVHRQALGGLITGYGNSITNELQLGLIYDTRDLELDPSKGTFAELTDEASSKVWGSGFNYNRWFFHYDYYHLLFSKKFKKLVFAVRAGMGYTTGNAPFFEYTSLWSSEGEVDGLGGSQTLRGYAQNRFVAPVMALGNFELRYRFWQVNILEQHLGFSIIPFLDAGGVWNNLGRISNLQNIRFSEGPALHIAWNEDTILRFEYGFCPEGSQFYFSLDEDF